MDLISLVAQYFKSLPADNRIKSPVRPVHVAAAHGYGPTMLAGAEILKLLKQFQIVLNDSAILFYKPDTDRKKYR